MEWVKISLIGFLTSLCLKILGNRIYQERYKLHTPRRSVVWRTAFGAFPSVRSSVRPFISQSARNNFLLKRHLQNVMT